MKKGIKLVTAFIMALALMFGGATLTSAKSFSGRSTLHAGSSSVHSGSYSGSYSGSRSTTGSNTYNSGYKRPSSNVSGYGTSSGSSFNQPRSSGWGHFFGGFATGMVASSLFGGLFHPFGGYYGAGYHGFSIFGIILDLVLLWIGFSIVKRFFFRR